MNKQVDHSWDYAVADTKYYTHGVHTYPAMMIPQVARRLIVEEGENAKIGLDPFCGSGSVLLEFKLAGINCYGVDINPLAVLVSKVKTTPIDPGLLRADWEKLRNKIGISRPDLPVKAPDFFNIDFWFKKPVIKRLVLIKEAIDSIKNRDSKDFFLVCFSETVRKCSNTRSGEFKLYRLPEQKLKVHEPDAFVVFSKIVEKNILGMNQFYGSITGPQKKAWVKLLNESSAKLPLDDKTIDLVVTSPPYGDSRTTVAYGQFTRLGLQWLGFKEELTKRLDQNGLGGKRLVGKPTKLPSESLDRVVEKISEKDPQRVLDVTAFFVDFNNCVKEINRVLSDNGKVCIVVGNRTVKGVKIPTDEIMVELFQALGYEHKHTFVRSIPNKRMPRVNSPTNIQGATESTMNEENIVVLTR